MTTHFTEGTKERYKRKLKASGKGCCYTFCLLNIARGIHNCSKRFFQHMQDRGNWTIIWVVNQKEDMQECYEKFGKSVDGLMTDCPTELNEFANSKEQASANKSL